MNMNRHMDQKKEQTDKIDKQESLINDFKTTKQSDPQYLKFSQDQLRLSDDTKVIKDSLTSLAGRVFQISAFINREVNELTRQMEKSMKELRERKPIKAMSSQQFSMSAMNNLALLLSEVLEKLQMSVSPSAQGNGKPQKSKGSIQRLKNLQQELGKKISDLKGSGQKGRKLSEELARMAAEQEMIRNELSKFQQALDKYSSEESSKDGLAQVIKMLKENEIDLVNKTLSERMIKRQEKIMVKLLEVANAAKDQETDEKRESKTANEYKNKFPESLGQYIKKRQKEIELLKKIPVDLSPFYKREVDNYFKRISEQY